MPNQPSICLLTNAPKSPFAQHLAMLYPECVTALDFREADHSPEVLKRFTHVVTMVTHRRYLEKLDYAAVRAFAQGGGCVVSCLFEYASFHGQRLAKTYVADRMRPGIRICVENDVTRGFAIGDETPWWGKVSGATDNQHPNQLYQRQIVDAMNTGAITILGRSTVNGGAVLVEEKLGSGRIVAMDLLSLKEPFWNSWGSTNKYLFLGNVVGGSVRYGKHYPRKLPYDEFAAEMARVAAENPALTFTREGPCSDGRPLCSLSLGNPAKPAFLFFGAIHGWEWENAYGLLHLAELLASDNPPEGLSRDDFYLKVVPILNPAGYDHDTRHNANGTDLNRNFDFNWDGYHDAGGDDVYQPWDYDYSGPGPASEPETQAAQRLIDALRPAGVLDFHTAHYVLLRPHKGDKELIDAIYLEIQERMKNRYLSQRPYGTEYLQVGMPNAVDFHAPCLFCYAAEKGTPASILIEMSGNRTDTQALVMNTDMVIEICLAMIQRCLARTRS